MAMTTTTEARGQCWPLLCWKKSCGGVVGTRSSRLRCLLPRLDGSIVRYNGDDNIRGKDGDARTRQATTMAEGRVGSTLPVEGDSHYRGGRRCNVELLCGKKSCGGVVGTRSLRLRCLLPRLEGSNGNYCESLKHSVDHYSVCHQGGCIGGGLTQRRWLAQPPPINAWLTMTIICGGCGAGDCGHTEGVHRQRAVEMAEEEIGNARSSRDIASAWLRKKMAMLGLYRQRATTTLEGKMVTLGLDRRR
ncbi:hypothetical protein BHE74_00031304 [Ensete ventricosum]|nr:hypothetical protein BHE74_00031304 [Ensete ventricosum]